MQAHSVRYLVPRGPLPIIRRCNGFHPQPLQAALDANLTSVAVVDIPIGSEDDVRGLGSSLEKPNVPVRSLPVVHRIAKYRPFGFTQRFVKLPDDATARPPLCVI